MVVGKSSNAASGATHKHPYIDNDAQHPTAELLQKIAASTTSNEQSKIEDSLRKNLPTDSGSGRSRIRRWFDKAGAYIVGTGQEEPDTQRHKSKNAHEFPEIPGEELRVQNLPRTREQLTSPSLEELPGIQPSIRFSERPDGEGLSTPMPVPAQDDEERLRREHLARQAKERDRMRRNREEMEVRDELRRERDELRHGLDPRPRDGG